MNIEKAYKLTIEKVIELESQGIKVLKRPSVLKNMDDVSGNIPRELWQTITFKFPTKEKAKLISEALDYLGLIGIAFDISGCCGERDWSLDWSFEYQTSDTEEHKECREWMEEEIDSEFCGIENN